MNKLFFFGIASLVLTHIFATSAEAQNMCYVNGAPSGTVPACGMGTGYYRPQPYTLSGGFPRVIRNPNSYYAPVGNRQQYWHQYSPSSGNYGPREPNPFSQSGRLSVPRAANHLFQTRIVPRFRR